MSWLQFEIDRRFHTDGCFANGWTQYEYVAACRHDQFYATVKHALRTAEFDEQALDDPALREDIVCAKFHIAGRCARWMFRMDAATLAGDGP